MEASLSTQTQFLIFPTRHILLIKQRSQRHFVNRKSFAREQESSTSFQSLNIPNCNSGGTSIFSQLPVSCKMQLI